MDNVTFYTTASQNAFTVAERVGDYAYTPTLGANEPTALEISAPFWQTRDTYTRPAGSSNITVPSPQNISNTVTAYYVDDLGWKDLGGGVSEFTRLWATIPATWQEDSQYAFEFPSYTASQNIGNANAITSLQTDYNYTPTRYNIAGTGIAANTGDVVFVDMTYTETSNVHVVGPFVVVDGTWADMVVVTGLSATYVNNSATGTVRKARPTREEPETITGDARIQHDYALTNGNVANIQNMLPTVQPFTPVVAATFAMTKDLTASTLPTATQYGSMIDAGTELVAEPSLRRPYAGYIHERTTIFVKAR